MTIISDTSVITNLLQIGQIGILPTVFGEILIPQAVFDELAIVDGQRRAVLALDWLEVKTVMNQELVVQLGQYLDLGESEAIVLALETRADFLLMDELKGRKKAKELGLQVTGLLGVLLKAKSEEAISVVRPILDELIGRAGFRIHSGLYEEIIKLAGED